MLENSMLPKHQKQTINTLEVEDAGTLSDDENFGLAAGIEFNADGTKMFVSFAQTDTAGKDLTRVINTYDLSTPYDVSTETFAGDSERCDFEVDSLDHSLPLLHILHTILINNFCKIHSDSSGQYFVHQSFLLNDLLNDQAL